MMEVLMIRVVNDFEGANPAGAEAIEVLAADRVRVRPFSEDGDGNYKFCLNIKAINEGDRPAPLTLEVDWDDLEYMDGRDYVLVGWGDNWRSVGGRVAGAVTSVDLTVEPGEWYVGLHPVYDLAAFEADRTQATASGFTERVIGRSQQGRDIVALAIGAAPEDEVPTVLVVSRFHPYETAGSFCASGLLQMLAEERRAGGALMNETRFVVVPVPNPDGVALGCCKRSRVGGPDLCHEGADSDDPAGIALRDVLAETDPDGYLDFHGWMYRDHDGLNYTHPHARDAFARKLADDALFNKDWKGRSLATEPRRPGDVCSRAYHDHGAVGMILSFSWFGRTAPQMREIGRRVLNAFCEVLRGV
jgi:hypothetical protein